jgi:hypothetical protein
LLHSALKKPLSNKVNLIHELTTEPVHDTTAESPEQAARRIQNAFILQIVKEKITELESFDWKGPILNPGRKLIQKVFKILKEMESGGFECESLKKAIKKIKNSMNTKTWENLIDLNPPVPEFKSQDLSTFGAFLLNLVKEIFKRFTEFCSTFGPILSNLVKGFFSFLKGSVVSTASKLKEILVGIVSKIDKFIYSIVTILVFNAPQLGDLLVAFVDVILQSIQQSSWRECCFYLGISYLIYSFACFCAYIFLKIHDTIRFDTKKDETETKTAKKEETKMEKPVVPECSEVTRKKRFFMRGVDCTDYLRNKKLEGKCDYITSFDFYEEFITVEYLSIPEQTCLCVKMIPRNS